MKNTVFVVLFFTAISLTSCDVLLQTANTVLESNAPLTKTDIARGLKEALQVSVDTAVTRLNRKDGYYLDPLVKLGLPPETNEVIEHARKVPGLDKKIDEFILQVNRSAEDAAAKAAPAFRNAILSMSIDDVYTILNGPNNAATTYLNQKTYSQLAGLYQPILTESLKKPFVSGVSAHQTWNEITTQWNKFATSLAGKLLDAKPINVELDEYLTHKALDGLFLKVADQEKEIRTDVNARVTDLLKRVFEK
jgi:hypothetical protein